jgi:hypothetical protein
MNQKTLISVLAVLVLILGGTTIYFLTAQKSVAPVVQTPVPVSKTVPVVQDETAGWKTYTNSKYGYAVKYNNDWVFTEFPEADGAKFALKNATATEPRDNKAHDIVISLMPRAMMDQKIPFADYVKIAGIQEIQNYESLASIEKITTKSGLTGYKATWNVQTMGQPVGNTFVSSPFYYFDSGNKNGDTIQIRCEGDEFLDACDKMAQTVTIK